MAAPTDSEPVLRIENLHKSFGHLEVLRGIDMEVRPGEVVVIFGRSGSGKSTLLRCINFLEEPTRGVVRLDGHRVGYDDAGGAVRRMSARELAQIGRAHV